MEDNYLKAHHEQYSNCDVLLAGLSAYQWYRRICNKPWLCIHFKDSTGNCLPVSAYSDAVILSEQIPDVAATVSKQWSTYLKSSSSMLTDWVRDRHIQHMSPCVSMNVDRNTHTSNRPVLLLQWHTDICPRASQAIQPEYHQTPERTFSETQLSVLCDLLLQYLRYPNAYTSNMKHIEEAVSAPEWLVDRVFTKVNSPMRGFAVQCLNHIVLWRVIQIFAYTTLSHYTHQGAIIGCMVLSRDFEPVVATPENITPATRRCGCIVEPGSRVLWLSSWVYVHNILQMSVIKTIAAPDTTKTLVSVEQWYHAVATSMQHAAITIPLNVAQTYTLRDQWPYDVWTLYTRRALLPPGIKNTDLGKLSRVAVSCMHHLTPPSHILVQTEWCPRTDSVCLLLHELTLREKTKADIKADASTCDAVQLIAANCVASHVEPMKRTIMRRDGKQIVTFRVGPNVPIDTPVQVDWLDLVSACRQAPEGHLTLFVSIDQHQVHSQHFAELCIAFAKKK